MEQSYDIFLAFHLYSLYASGFLMLFYLFLTQGGFSSEFYFIRRIVLFLPAYYLFLAIIFFTGFLLLALKSFEMNFYFALMIFLWFLILALAIFHYKQFKKARMLRRYKNFRMISFFILILEIFILFVPLLMRKYF